MTERNETHSTMAGAYAPTVPNPICFERLADRDNFACSGPDFASISDAVHFLREITVSGGPSRAQFDRLFRCFLMLEQNRVSFEVIREAIWPSISTTNCIQGLGFLKPFGYAGDHEMMDRIYTRWVSNDPALRKWDEYFHIQHAPVAVRNRKAYFHRVLDGLRLERNAQRLDVLNLGCGPARDIHEYLPQTRNIRFECVDHDLRAIEYARRLCGSFADQVVFRCENVLRLRLERDFDLIWSAGLFDYFADRMFLVVLRRLLVHTGQAGELVIGNFCTRNPSRYWMESVGDWKIHHRTDSDLRKLAHAAGVDDRRIMIGAEPEGVNLFLHVKGAK